MSRERLLMLLGILVVVSPFVGLPLAILTWVLPVLGALVFAIGTSFAMRKRSMQIAQQAHAPEISERSF
jgi:hypothetical protein